VRPLISHSIRFPTRQRTVLAEVNVLWGTLNAVVGYFLVCHVGEFYIHRIPDVLILGAGGLLMALMLSRAFGRIYGGQ
jgi:hypothetical protein